MRESLFAQNMQATRRAYPSMLVPIVQLIVVNSIQTYKNKNLKNVHTDIHSNTVTDATSPINQEIIIVHAK